MLYKYGMKSRGCSIGCQPKGLVHYEDASKLETGYWSYIYYGRKLYYDEIKEFELDYIGEV